MRIQLSIKNGIWQGMSIGVIAILFLTAMSTPSSEAAEGKRVAFVVGVGTYDKLADDKQLKNPVNDAEGVAAKLAEMGYQVTKAPNLTRPAFNEKWQNVLDSLTAQDTFVLFFSGHGVQVDGQNYLLPRDIPYIEYGRQAQLTREAISLNELLADLSTGDRPHPKNSVVILDACRDNPLIPPGYKKGSSTPRGLANVPESEGIFVMYSAASNTTALDRLSPNDKVKYSVFTRVLLPLMGRTDLTIQQLSTALKNQVWKLAKSARGEQRPTYYDGILGEFCLPGCVARVDKGTTEIKEDFSAIVQPSSPNEKIGKDGAPMVLIPTGSFLMGSTKDEVDRAAKDCVKEFGKDQQTCEGWYQSELPQHKVSIGEFYMDKYEVTNRLFQPFVQQTGHRTTAEKEGSAAAFVEGKGWENVKGANWQRPEGGTSVFQSNRGDHPVVAVSWDDAMAYCRWAGKRLPTEAEFEYGTRAGTTTKYWWGNGSPGSRRVANIADESAKTLLKNILTDYDDGYARTAPVGLFEANPFGLHDMTGNVAEWTADWFDEGYYNKSPNRNPQGPPSGDYRVVRGGSWNYEPDFVRSATRHWASPSTRNFSIGFRCAQDLPN